MCMGLTYSSNGNKVNCLVGQPYDVDLIAFSGEFGGGTPDLSPSPALVKRLHESRHGHSIIFLPVDFFHFGVLMSVDSETTKFHPKFLPNITFLIQAPT